MVRARENTLVLSSDDDDSSSQTFFETEPILPIAVLSTDKTRPLIEAEKEESDFSFDNEIETLSKESTSSTSDGLKEGLFGGNTLRESDVEFPELKTTSFLLLFGGKFISSIALLKKTCPRLAPYVPKSMRSTGTRKYWQRAFFIFRQFPSSGEVYKKRL